MDPDQYSFCTVVNDRICMLIAVVYDSITFVIVESEPIIVYIQSACM